MELEKNPKLRPIYRWMLRLEDRIYGRSFPGMKRIKQISSSHCGPAVLAMLFSFLGVSVSQRKITNSLRVGQKIKRQGVTVREIAKAARIYGRGRGLSFWRKSGSSINDLALAVNKYKSPVGVEWQGVFYEAEDEDNGHYSVVTSVNKKAGNLRIADPFAEYAGRDRKFGLKFFEKRWWDINIISGRRITDKKVMFVLTPKSAAWPKKLGMKK